MNEYDIEDALRRFGDDTPNLRRAVVVLDQLKEWTNAHSDGWQYWRLPKQAAKKLMALVEAATVDYYGGEVQDITRTELARAFTPIKAFLTRQKVDHREVFGG